MYRSEKEKVKHVEKKVVVDQETQDYFTYLGGDIKTLVEQATEAEEMAAQD